MTRHTVDYWCRVGDVFEQGDACLDCEYHRPVHHREPYQDGYVSRTEYVCALLECLADGDCPGLESEPDPYDEAQSYLDFWKNQAL